MQKQRVSTFFTIIYLNRRNGFTGVPILFFINDLTL